MEEFQAAIKKAQDKIKLADHMLTQTYPLVRDTKLLVAVMENIFLALTNGMASVLYYERTFKSIPPFVDNFENKFKLFREKCALKYKLRRDYIDTIIQVKDSVIAHRKSPIEFARKDNFVICSENYKLKTITIDQIKKYIDITKTFLKEASVITSKNERIFR